MNCTGTSKRGFTLLEVLLATTILAMVMGLAASVWVQMTRWSGVTAELQRTQRVDQALRLWSDQWADRRFIEDLPGVSPFGITPDEMRFLTATPALFVDAPLVMARYVIEPTRPGQSGAGATYELRYEERRVTDLAPPSARLQARRARGISVDGEPVEPPKGEELARRQRLVLISGAEELLLERYGPRWAPETALPLTVERRDAEGRRYSRAAVRPEDAAHQDPADVPPYRWRPLEDGYSEAVPALRVVGKRDGRAFDLVLLIGNQKPEGGAKKRAGASGAGGGT